MCVCAHSYTIRRAAGCYYTQYIVLLHVLYIYKNVISLYNWPAGWLFGKSSLRRVSRVLISSGFAPQLGTTAHAALHFMRFI